jgi:hypothetical protein
MATEKREPREWWLAIDEDGGVSVFPTEQLADETGWPIVHVREVLPEEDGDGGGPVELKT